MNEVVIFCESYPQIKNALYLAVQNHDNHSITIMISGMHNIYKFFNLVNERVFQGRLNVVYFDIYRNRTAMAGNRIIRAFYLLPEMVKERQYLKSIFNKNFAQLSGAEVFFFSRYFNPSTYYLLRTLRTTNRLVYMPEPSYDVVSIPQVAPANIFEAMYLLKYKLVYGYDIALGKHPIGQITTRMPDKFLRERIARVISQEERDNMLKDFDVKKFKVFDGVNYSVMFFHEDLVEHDYIADPGAFERRLAEVFNILGKHFPAEKVALKYHPRYPESKTALSFCIRLPDFIPAEFLYNEEVKIYLSITSQALANVERGVAVSLVDMVNFKDETIREQLKNALIQWSHSEIRFPQSLDEFERILINIKNDKLEEVK